jgi:hypothetical protein
LGVKKEIKEKIKDEGFELREKEFDFEKKNLTLGRKK